jgi:hypothetical protein
MTPTKQIAFLIIFLLCLQNIIQGQECYENQNRKGQYTIHGAFFAPIALESNMELLPGLKGGVGKVLHRKVRAKEKGNNKFSVSETILLANVDFGFFQGNFTNLLLKGNCAYIYRFSKHIFWEANLGIGLARTFDFFNYDESIKWHQGDFYLFPSANIGLGYMGKIANRTTLFRLKPGMLYFLPAHNLIGRFGPVLEFEVTYFLNKQ